MSIQYFTLVAAVPQGTIAVGGYSAAPLGYNKAHAQDSQGRPLIPATTLRGALRSSLEAVLRAAGRAACVRGSGWLAEDWALAREAQAEAPTHRVCTLGPNETHCDACRLFGTADAEGQVESHVSALILQDALVQPSEQDAGKQAYPLAERHGVSLDRQARVASEGRFFNALLPQAGRRLVFHAEGRIARDAEPLFGLLKTAAALTTHLGGGQSRGMGRVELSVVPITPEVQSLRVTESAVTLEVVLERPAHIGETLASGNIRGTRVDIPGATLRGAVGFGLAEVLGAGANADAPFQRLVDAKAGAVFDFLYPCAEADGIDGVVGPWPLTARACKCTPSEFATDDLFARIAIARAGDDVSALVQAAGLVPKVCAQCQGPLKPRKLMRGQHAAVQRRSVTRLARDRTARSAEDGMLFTTELIKVGTRFVGQVRRIPSGAGAETPRTRLEQALRLPLSVGRGRALGWGRIQIRTIESPGLAPVVSRQSRFVAAADRVLGEGGAARLVPLTCLTPLVLPPGADAAVLLSAALGPHAVLVVKARRFDLENGWDQRRGLRPFQRSLKAGSVFVFEWSGEPSSLMAQLKQLERDGVGERTEQGFGRLLAFDPAFSHQPTDREQEQKMSDENVTALTRALVLAAESAIQAAMDQRRNPRDLSKSQLSQLVGVAQEAQCHEEVANYLRYQGGRRGPWSVGMVNGVIAAFETLRARADFEHASEMKHWRSYATFMARHFTYLDAVAQASRGGHRG